MNYAIPAVYGAPGEKFAPEIGRLPSGVWAAVYNYDKYGIDSYVDIINISGPLRPDHTIRSTNENLHHLFGKLLSQEFFRDPAGIRTRVQNSLEGHKLKGMVTPYGKAQAQSGGFALLRGILGCLDYAPYLVGYDEYIRSENR